MPVSGCIQVCLFTTTVITIAYENEDTKNAAFDEANLAAQDVDGVLTVAGIDFCGCLICVVIGTCCGHSPFSNRIIPSLEVRIANSRG